MRSQLNWPRMALARQIAFSLCLLVVGLVLLGCGGGDSSAELSGEPFTAQNEEDFNGKLDKIDGYVAEGRCDTAQSNLDALVTAVGNVPPETDEGLKTDLLDLLSQLGDQIDSECVPADTATTSSTSTEPTTTDSSSTTSSESSTTTKSDSTTSSTESTTEPPPDETTPPEDGFNPGVGTPPGQGEDIPGTSGGTAPGGKKKADKAKEDKKPKGPKKTKDAIR